MHGEVGVSLPVSQFGISQVAGDGPTLVWEPGPSARELPFPPRSEATWDGTTMKMYIDGVEDCSGGSSCVSYSTPIVTNSTALGIGAKGDGSQPLQGGMDDVRIYNCALSASEIAALSRLVGHWRMESIVSGPVMVEAIFSLLSGFSNSSTMLFHCPQSGHRPIHLTAWCPQLWHTYMNRFFLVILFRN